jgi:SAM-dependent methyltransferase
LSIRSGIKRVLPTRVCSAYARFRTRHIQRQYQSLSRSEVFERVYAIRAWNGGSAGSGSSSGSGSTGRCAGEYCALVGDLLRAHGIASVADLGCGDFKVGRVVAGMVASYTGIDIAQPVIDWNARLYSSERVRFVCADVVSDALPPAGAALVRQVLQHLSNIEIQAALENILRTYRLVFITEHVYLGAGCSPNRDIPHGPGTRVPLRSGVFVDRPPFNLSAEVAGDIGFAPREILRTWVVQGIEG